MVAGVITKRGLLFVGHGTQCHTYDRWLQGQTVMTKPLDRRYNRSRHARGSLATHGVSMNIF